MLKVFNRNIKSAHCVLAIKNKKHIKFMSKCENLSFLAKFHKSQNFKKNPLNFNLTQTFSRAIKPHGPILKT